MATATINWVPGGGTITVDQEVHCKGLLDEVWLLVATVDASATSAIVEDLGNNVVWQFRIMNNCSGGVTMFSEIAEAINFTCPFPVNVNVDGMTLVGFFFPHVGGNVDGYFVELLSVDDEVLQSKTLTPSGPMVVSFWGGLTPGTDYQMRISPRATGELDVYSMVCDPISFITVPCPAPTDVVAESYVLAD